jgi:hypothetical protein
VIEYYTALELTIHDIALLAMGPALGLIGAFVRVLMVRNELETLPQLQQSESGFSWWHVYTRINWYFAWGIVGLGSGLLVALLFVGSLGSETNLLSRVLALALLAGYGAPSMWKSQQEALTRVLDGRIQGTRGVR